MSAPDRIMAWPTFWPESVTGEWSANTYYGSGAEPFLKETPARLHAEELAEALRWISKRDNPANPADAMLDPKYIPEEEVRRVAHDIIACARALLAKLEKEEGK